MSAKHTPGPWEWDWKRAALFKNGESAVVLEVNQDPDTGMEVRISEADAALIESAPDLLQACEVALDFIVNGVELGYIDLSEVKDTAEAVSDILRATVAKAKREK